MKSKNAVDLIREDHRKVERLYRRYNSGKTQNSDKQALAEDICHELEVHAQLEESIFYPALQMKDKSDGPDLVSEALKEHSKIKHFISQLRNHFTDTVEGEKIVHQLLQSVQHHVDEEESKMLPKAVDHLYEDLARLGMEMRQKKRKLNAVYRQQGGKEAPAQRVNATDDETSMSSNIEQSIDVRVPVRTVYNQWTQFEEFPNFMGGIKEVTQLDDTHLHWKAIIGGEVKEWDSVITEQLPDQRIAWRNTTGARNAGVVTFHRLAENTTRVMLQLDYEPEGLIENVGDMIGVVSTRIRADLQRFKDFIESRGRETGAWRGEVTQHQD